ncbi:MAG TPA: hypothetical protein VGY54_06605, partial [Polyangiaceae bacterium]|nr:hypothetical protein [Polyangiaceae bacterium]
PQRSSLVTVWDRAHRPGCQSGNCCDKPGAEDADHREIQANPNRIIKTCSARDPQRSCGGGGK